MVQCLKTYVKLVTVCLGVQRYHPGQHVGHPVHRGARCGTLLRTGRQRQERREQNQSARRTDSGE